MDNAKLTSSWLVESTYKKTVIWLRVSTAPEYVSISAVVAYIGDVFSWVS